MNNKPVITVITVCYNVVSTLETTMLSVLNQTYPNVEYILIDGGSTDGTVDIIKKYADRLSYWVSEPDRGIYDAMNKGVKVATGDFLLFLGADDILYELQTLQKCASKLTNYEKVFYGQVKWSNNGMLFWGKFNKWKWGISNLCHQAIFYPHDIYKKYFYELKYKVFADYAYNLKLIEDHIIFEYIGDVITLYNVNGFSAVAKDPQFEKDKKKLVLSALGHLPYYWGVTYRFLLTIKKYIFKHD